MKKTNKMATIGQLNGQTGKYTYIERRVYEDEKGVSFVLINDDFISLIWLRMNGRKVNVWFN